MRFLLSVSFVLVQSLAFSQIDQKKLDSLSSSIDASVKAYQQWQDSFTKNQVKKSNKSNPATPVDIGILQQGKTKSKQSIYLIIMVILVFILMIFFFTRRKGAPVTKLFTTIVLSLFSFPILNAQHFDSIKIQTVPAESTYLNKATYYRPPSKPQEKFNYYERKKLRRRESHAWGFIALVILLAGSVLYEIYRIIKTETQS